MRRKSQFLIAIAVMVGMLIPAAALAQGSGPRGGLVSADGEVTAGERPLSSSGVVGVVVHLNKPSLSQVSQGMTAAQRVAYAAEVAALQDQVAAQVQALGGTVVGRFKTLSSGLAVSIDASRVADLRALASVAAVRQVNNYEVDLNETVPFIGAADLQAAGLDGTGVTVAVLDDGVDYTHIKLGGSGIPADYTACAATPNVISPACAAFFPNDKIVGGYDYVGSTWPSTPEAPDPNPIARSFHGTHVADIIGGWGLDGTPTGDYRGVAPGVEMYLFKVCSEISTSCSGLALLQATDAAADLDGDPATFDPADVVNASIGQPYGQPEDDWTAFTNELVEYGNTIYVISAGNSSDKPFIVGSASTAIGAISVAQTSVPSDKLFFIRINAPTAGLITNTAFQDWSVPLPSVGAITGNVLYDTTSTATRIGCTNAAGASPWAPGALTGRIVLVDRGTCAGSMKVSNAAAAGAKLVIIALVAPGAPFSFGFGGGTPNVPAFMVTQADGTRLKTAGTNITMDPNDPTLVLSLLDTMVGTSSRGPRNHDNYIKPDIGAPGGSRSAEFGTGTGLTPFGGTSGAAPMVSGSAALLRQKYGGTPLPDTWHHEFGSEMPVFMYKSLLMNTANTTVYQDFYGGTLAPITRIGGGRVDVLAAAESDTLAWDETDHWIDSRFRTGSMSFGYQAVTGRYVTERHGVVANLSDHGRWYDLSASFRYANDENLGISLKVSPSHLYVPAHGYKAFFVKLTADASQLRTWDPFAGPNKGVNGLNGGLLTTQEYDGYINIDGGDNNTVHLAWQILPRRAASVRPTRHSIDFGHHDTSKTLTLRNPALYQAGDVDVFALVDESPNIYYYEVFDDISFIDECTGGVFPGGSPGPGCNETLIDIKEVGVRDYGADTASTADDFIEFGVTIWDSPYRASQFPVEFDVYIDSNRDGVDDWVVFNYDLALNGSDGRNVVWRCRANFTGCSAFFFTDSGFDTQNWILTVPAGAIGVAPGQAFNFQVFAADGYFTGAYTDASPADGVSYHTYTMGKPKYAWDDYFPVVPANGSANLAVTKVSGGGEASPSQIGLLLMYRQAPIERESDSVHITP